MPKSFAQNHNILFFLWHPANAKILKRGQRLVVFRQSSSYVQPSSGWPGDVPVIQGCPPKGCLFFTTPLMRQTFLLTSSTLLHTRKRATSRVFTDKGMGREGLGGRWGGEGGLESSNKQNQKKQLCATPRATSVISIVLAAERARHRQGGVAAD